MRSLTKRIAQTAAVVALLAPASTVIAKNQVPLKGTITIVPAGVPEEFNPPILTQTRSITGQVSHLGQTEGVIVQNVNVLDLSFFGEFTMYAANGDSVTGEVTGKLSPTDDPNILEVDEDIIITGGTGRLAGATGTATGEGQAFRNTGRAEETFQGTISSPGS
jgi:hypothetical protein